MRNTKEKEAGAIIILVALMIAFLVGVVIFVVNTNYVYTVKAKMRALADSAATAGAASICPRMGCWDESVEAVLKMLEEQSSHGTLGESVSFANLPRQGRQGRWRRLARQSVWEYREGRELKLSFSIERGSYLSNSGFESLENLSSWQEANAGIPFFTVLNAVKVTINRPNVEGVTALNAADYNLQVSATATNRLIQDQNIDVAPFGIHVCNLTEVLDANIQRTEGPLAGRPGYEFEDNYLNHYATRSIPAEMASVVNRNIDLMIPPKLCRHPRIIGVPNMVEDGAGDRTIIPSLFYYPRQFYAYYNIPRNRLSTFDALIASGGTLSNCNPFSPRVDPSDPFNLDNYEGFSYQFYLPLEKNYGVVGLPESPGIVTPIQERDVAAVLNSPAGTVSTSIGNRFHILNQPMTLATTANQIINRIWTDNGRPVFSTGFQGFQAYSRECNTTVDPANPSRSTSFTAGTCNSRRYTFGTSTNDSHFDGGASPVCGFHFIQDPRNGTPETETTYTNIPWRGRDQFWEVNVVIYAEDTDDRSRACRGILASREDPDTDPNADHVIVGVLPFRIYDSDVAMNPVNPAGCELTQAPNAVIGQPFPFTPVAGISSNCGATFGQFACDPNPIIRGDVVQNQTGPVIVE